MAGPLERVRTGKTSYLRLNAKDAAAYRAAHPEWADTQAAAEPEAPPPAPRGRRGVQPETATIEASSAGHGAE